MREENFFYDEAKIYVESGRGGNGCMSFRREKYVPRGGPDGGHGGDGGDVVLRVDRRLNTLSGFRRRTHFKAEFGKQGEGNDKHGKSAPDLEIVVPPGTIVRDAETGEILADLVRANDRVIVAAGGRGGRGNSAFASSKNQAPRRAEKGEPGKIRWLTLELKLLADVGIIGLPNAGKSTLLSVISAARPKIADYPFTTLIPNLGVATIDDRDIVVADMPGLIEGAHAGTGLGDKFLRHIERTRVLIHLLDGALDDPLAGFETINRELALHQAQLADKPQIIVLNKLDLPTARAAFPKIQKKLAKRKLETHAISAVTGDGVRDLLRAVAAKLAELPAPAPAVEEIPVIRPAVDENAFSIAREQHAFRLRGVRIERLIAMTNFDQEEAILHLHRVFKAMGVTPALEKAGVREGSLVRIGDVELEWRESASEK
ncbi:MAG: GTPase ObgE [Chloroflexi bacterium]|nr:GTPase ObgE [Chloroflexota bacterium]